jgi:hypothetical protein
MKARRLIAAVLVAGVVVGGAIAMLARGDVATGRAAAPVAAALSADQPPIPLPPHGPVTIAARAADPGGALPWGVRHFTTTTGGQTYSCVQLGRLNGKRFGWVAPAQPFRLARFDQLDVPTLCGAGFARGLPALEVATLTTDAATGLPRPDRTVVWGILPPGFVSARLAGGTTLRAGAGRVVLDVLPGQPVGSPRLRGTLRASGGAVRRFAYPDPYVRPARAIREPGDRLRAPTGGRARPGAERVAVRVPDPAGGAAWGVLTAPSTTGATCVSSPARIVGSRLANVVPRLGLASPNPIAQFDCTRRRAPSSARPVRIDVLVASLSQEDPSGTEQLRRLRDRTVLSGRTTAAVTAVTITTSRDIRTLVPDPRTHVVLAVYDGTFPGERLKITATLRDGRHVTTLQSSGA